MIVSVSVFLNLLMYSSSLYNAAPFHRILVALLAYRPWRKTLNLGAYSNTFFLMYFSCMCLTGSSIYPRPSYMGKGHFRFAKRDRHRRYN